MAEENQTLVSALTSSVIEQLAGEKIYTFQMPQKVIIGEHSTIRIAQEILRFGKKRALIVTDEGIVRLKLHESTLHALQKKGIETSIFPGVRPDPDIKVVEAGVEAAKRHGAEIIIGLGGGSPIDAAKMVATMMCNPGRIQDYEGRDRIRNHRLPLIAVPTTAGTGSEVTSISVITDSGRKIKMLIESFAMIPDVAVIDPMLMINLPPSVTAATGMDVLTHAIEAYIAMFPLNVARALAMRAIELVSAYIRLAVGSGRNIEARHRMAVASLMAGMAFSNAGLGICHATAHQVGAKYKISHGGANALMLPAALRFNLLVRQGDFREIARALGRKVEHLTIRQAAGQAVEAVEELIRDIGLPLGLKDIGADPKDFEEMARHALEDMTLTTNPREASLKDICDIYQEAF